MLTQKIQDERDEREIYTHNRGGGERHGCRGKWLGLMSLDLCAGDREVAWFCTRPLACASGYRRALSACGAWRGAAVHEGDSLVAVDDGWTRLDGGDCRVKRWRWLWEVKEDHEDSLEFEGD